MYCATSLTKRLDQVEFYYEATMKVPFLYEPWFHLNMLTFPNLFCIPQEDPQQIFPMEWGFIPSWAETEIEAFREKNSTFLVKAEQLLDSDIFGDAVRQRRCLIIADGIYLQPFAAGNSLPKYCFLKGHRPFTIGGVYNTYDEGYWSVSAITIPRKSIFKRMPLVLDPEFEEIWIDQDLKEAKLQEILTTSFMRESFQTISVTRDILNKDIDTNTPDILGL